MGVWRVSGESRLYSRVITESFKSYFESSYNVDKLPKILATLGKQTWTPRLQVTQVLSRLAGMILILTGSLIKG